MSDFHASAASSDYIQDLLSRYQSDPTSLPADWRAALDLLTAYFPAVLSPFAGATALTELIRRFGHLAARVDPLERQPPGSWGRLQQSVTELLATHPDLASDDHARALLGRYTGSLSLETGHIDDPARIEWIIRQHESTSLPSPDARRRALAAVIRAEAFERFMGLRYLGKKRFGVEGGESLHALLERLFERAAGAGVQEVIIGTMHRGRLGLMANLFGQPLEQLFSRMNGEYPLAASRRAADVPYHLGTTATVQTAGGPLLVRLLPNPSHLEAINMVAIGLARRRLEELGSASKIMSLVLHTDASVIAQGVVAEGIQFSELPGYSVGGVIHVVVNNQVGFTTNPHEARTSRHCTGQWKAVDSLIAHVNGDDLDSVIAAADLAFDFRGTFAADSVIDLVTIRRNGHNELDEPRFTQPQYYALSDTKQPISATYAEQLQAAGIIAADYVESTASEYKSHIEAAYASADGHAVQPTVADVPATPEFAELDCVAELASRIPPEGGFNPKVQRLVEQRAVELTSGVAWATAELLSLGSILSAGWNVRMSGQDVDRGAFSQRHFSVFDSGTGERHTTFAEPPPGWGRLDIFNSTLSEYAALAFEYGYSLDAGRTLTVWEAQFGDFANGAQTVFDQFISSAYEKWGQASALVVLLPHGLEGQGPEHSSARIERMLHLAARTNLRIAHPSTSANYFHLLRSQILEPGRRPLIVFTPKKLLRLKAAMSSRQEMDAAGFQPVLVSPAQGRVERVLLCSGKIYYDLASAAAKQTRSGVMLVRLEQLYPFPAAEVAQALRAAGTTDVRWVQEEPANYGAWSWLRPQLEGALQQAGLAASGLRCISRPENPSPAGSFHTLHDEDQRQLVELALAAGDVPRKRLASRG